MMITDLFKLHAGVHLEILHKEILSMLNYVYEW